MTFTITLKYLYTLIKSSRDVLRAYEFFLNAALVILENLSAIVNTTLFLFLKFGIFF